jgi:hypothetical protein
MVLEGRIVKAVAWYDNEWGYSQGPAAGQGRGDQPDSDDDGGGEPSLPSSLAGHS